MNKQKVVLLVLVTAVIGGGVFAWKYFGTSAGEVEVSKQGEEIDTSDTFTPLSLEEVRELVSQFLSQPQYLDGSAGFGYGFEHLSDVEEIEDLDNDGLNDFLATANGSGGTCVGGTNYKVFYSPGKQEYFVVSKGILERLPRGGEASCTVIDQGNIWDACSQGSYVEFTCASNNVNDPKNSNLKGYLEDAFTEE